MFKQFEQCRNNRNGITFSCTVRWYFDPKSNRDSNAGDADFVPKETTNTKCNSDILALLLVV